MLGCAPRALIDPGAAPDQAKCGVDGRSGVSKAQARCIARLDGLEPTLRGKVTQDTYRVTGDVVWMVCNQTEPTIGGQGGKGECRMVDRTTGQIVGRETWEHVRVE